jgi:hypothetical protein
MNDDRGVTVTLKRYRGDPGSATVTSGDVEGAGALSGSDVLSDADMGIEDWDRELHPDDDGKAWTGDRTMLTKRQRCHEVASAGEAYPDDYPEENNEWLPGTNIELTFLGGETEVIPNAELVGCRGPVPDHQNPYRVPIQREVGDDPDDSDPDHIRGAKYANLLFGTDYGQGDVVEVIYLDRVHPEFCARIERSRPAITDDPLYIVFKRDPDVICVDDADLLPPEFDRDRAKSPEVTV